MRPLSQLQLLCLGGDLRREGAILVFRVLDRCSLEGALEGAHRILLLTCDCDDPAASWNLEDVLAVVHLEDVVTSAEYPRMAL